MAQSVEKSYNMVPFMSKNLAVKKAQGILFLIDNDGDAVCGNGCVPYSSNTAQNNVTENICAINKTLVRCYNNVTFTLKMVMAAYTKMLEHLQQMTWLKTKVSSTKQHAFRGVDVCWLYPSNISPQDTYSLSTPL
jgi:hypothetical protein